MSATANPGLQRQIDQLYPMLAHPLQDRAAKKGMKIRATAHYLDIIHERNIVRLAIKHLIYGDDIIKYFDYYFTSVKSEPFNGYNVVDYSLPKYHDLEGYPYGPVYFPSFSEPLVTTEQYLDFADLKPGSSVIDLGAYAGLTSILFKEKVGASGKVVAVDADVQNIAAMQKNLKHYHQQTGNEIDVIRAAVWSHCDGLEFSSEGNMGSSASEIVGTRRGDMTFVESLTLDKIVEMSNLEKLDFIKCDVEGAEAVIFENAEVLRTFHPRIVIETHIVGGTLTMEKCTRDLEKYGYECRPLHQTGIGDIPLLECYPPAG